MIYLGAYKIGDVVPYVLDFHDDNAQLADPATPTARLRALAGTWSDLTAPAKQDAKTGLFGGTIDTAGYAAGLYFVDVRGVVATAKTVGCVIAFHVIANTEDDMVTSFATMGGQFTTAVGDMSDEFDAALAEMSARFNVAMSVFGAADVTVTSPVAASGTITVYAGDDYASADARAITVTVPDAGHVLGLDDVGAVVKLKATQATWTAPSVASTTDGYTVTFEVTAAQTAAITRTQHYELEATLANGHVVTLAGGSLVARADIPAVS